VSDAFHILDPGRRDAEARSAFEKQTIPPAIGSHKVAARHFQADKALVVAVNAALAVGAPLLLTGEPGTGKTQIAHWLAYHFDIEDRLFVHNVRSSSVAADLLYRFDTVAYFSDAQDRDRKEPLNRAKHIQRGVLWKAFEAQRSIVLVDEIDKAPKDFPNDLLHVLDQHWFDVPEIDDKITKLKDVAPPLVVITSNSERRLPEPFLRRCIFHNIALDEDLVERAVKARAGDFPRLDEAAKGEAIARFWDLRKRELRKPPATSELLVWLTLLSARGTTAKELKVALASLPALPALVKDRDDLGSL
jgi:MoxR-like ATPase